MFKSVFQQQYKPNQCIFRMKLTIATILFAVLISTALNANAQWLLNFGTASTVQPKDFAFISGTGMQFTFLNAPTSANLTPFLAHAGIRVGLSPNLDIGYRLCTVALPFSTVGPTLGSAMDLKLRVTPADVAWQVGIIGGGGLAFVRVLDKNKTAWSPGGAVVLTHAISPKTSISVNGRYVETFIPTATGGSNANYVKAYGGSIGMAASLNPVISMMPELGVFGLNGKMNNTQEKGIGLQFGLVMKVDWLKTKNK